jgi:ubiquinol-cytochrome c reductase cytochrome c subunit
MKLKKAHLKTLLSVTVVIIMSIFYAFMINDNTSLNNSNPASSVSSTVSTSTGTVSTGTASTNAGVTTTGSPSQKVVSGSDSTAATTPGIPPAGKPSGGDTNKVTKAKFVGPLLYQGSKTRATYSQVREGQTLFDESCSSCHGANASGTDRAPNLVGLGPATIQFWVSTGRMPLSNPIIQPVRKPVKFTPSQILDIVAFVSSKAPGGVLIPNIKSYNGASIADGASLFDINCAGCHTITGAGDALASGAYAPSLHQATPEQVAEAIRTGPANMPRFNPGVLTNAQVNSLVKYVTQGIQKPDNAGGWNLGGVGPVAEGFIGLLIGVGLLMLAALWVGDRK